jgi:hypothetical protein
MRVSLLVILILACCNSDTSGSDMSICGTLPCCDTIQPGKAYPTGACSIDRQECLFGGEHGGTCTCESAQWICIGPFLDMARHSDLLSHD